MGWGWGVGGGVWLAVVGQFCSDLEGITRAPVLPQPRPPPLSSDLGWVRLGRYTKPSCLAATW